MLDRIKFRPLSMTEVFLIQAVFYIVLWLWNDHAATILTLSFTAIALFILVISLIAEVLDSSKVPRWYFWVMGISIVTPLIIGAFFLTLKNGTLDWMKF
jgi:drug/metabolite transporter superfamily protein YnfA